jgi:hypothetical protein
MRFLAFFVWCIYVATFIFCIPDNVDCYGSDDYWAMDYSHKRNRKMYHGGIDLPAPWGTPMRAVAAGSVVAMYTADKSKRGNEVYLRHAPDQTGLPMWTYSAYGHLAFFYSQSPKYTEANDTIVPVDGFWLDPMAFYRQKPNSSIANDIWTHESDDIHYEGEISFIVKCGELIGVGSGIDLTKRKIQSELKKKGLPWERAKAFAAFPGISPFQVFMH